ncbi:MAG: hypothetical protein AAF990_05045 [Bacteroidota bacterium]
MYCSPNLPSFSSPESLGKPADLKLLLEDRWLIDTEVRYLLEEKRSLWYLSMLYIAVDNPLKFICKKIDTYPTEKKAKTFAKILQRGIRKDARGTLKTNTDAFHFCDN